MNRIDIYSETNGRNKYEWCLWNSMVGNALMFYFTHLQSEYNTF